MKVQSVQLKYFKRFHEPPVFDFTNPETGLAQDLIVLVGMNGAGKTSLLQAIAATVGVATGRLQKLSDLTWAGYNYELLANNWGRVEPEVNVTVQFSTAELQSIQEFYKAAPSLSLTTNAAPEQNHLVNLHWRGDQVWTNNPGDLLQFKGRDFAKQLVRTKGFSVFERIGTILWYTEQRTSTSLTTEEADTKIEITDDLLRDRLSKWRQFHQTIVNEDLNRPLRPGQKDIYADVERAYQTIFPERTFVGPALREQIDQLLAEPWFYLSDGKHQYEISEMSGGERAVFPILMDFANWNVHNSVILIDEIELHLHPPMQQAFLRALPKLGKNNQFIITTHSDHVARLVPEAVIIRLEG